MWDEYESVKVCGMSVRGMDGCETYQHFRVRYLLFLSWSTKVYCACDIRCPIPTHQRKRIW